MSATLESLEPQALVDVVLDSATEPFVTTVKDVSGLRVVLEAPVDRGGRLVLPGTGMGGLLVWRGDRELVQAPLAVLSTSRPPAPQWSIKVTGTPSPCQRRSFVRADVELPAVLHARGATYDVTAQDVSEGGLRCTAASAGDLALKDRLRVQVSLGGTPWDLEVDVVRLRHTPGGAVDLGLRFHGLAIPDADRIRSFVFAEQRRSRATGGL